MLHHIGIKLKHKDGFSEFENSYIKSAYYILYIVYDDYGVISSVKGMNMDLFKTTDYGDFDDGGKATERFFPGNSKQWTFTQSKGFT